MKINFGMFKQNDTAEAITKKLTQRPSDYILFQTTPAFGGGLQGCRGRKSFQLMQQRGAVVTSIFQ